MANNKDSKIDLSDHNGKDSSGEIFLLEACKNGDWDAVLEDVTLSTANLSYLSQTSAKYNSWTVLHFVTAISGDNNKP